MPRSPFHFVEYEARLDWLTITSFPSRISRAKFEDFFMFLKEQKIQGGEEAKEVAGAGYKGEQIGDSRFMERAKDRHLMISFWGEGTPDFAAQIIGAGFPHKNTRIDGRILAKFNEPDFLFGTRYSRAIRMNDKAKGKKEHTVQTPYRQGHGDSGLTIGNRNSDCYLRMYDHAFKHQKKKECLLIALEAELKNIVGSKFWLRYQEESDKPKLVTQMVTSKFEAVGITDPIFDKVEPLKISGTRPVTGDDGSIMHLDNTTSKTMQRLITNGRAADLIAWALRHGFIDKNGVFLPGLATPEEVEAAQEFFVNRLDRTGQNIEKATSPGMALKRDIERREARNRRRINNVLTRLA